MPGNTPAAPDQEIAQNWLFVTHFEQQAHQNNAQSLLHYTRLGCQLWEKEEEFRAQGFTDTGAETCATRWAADAFHNVTGDTAVTESK